MILMRGLDAITSVSERLLFICGFKIIKLFRQSPSGVHKKMIKYLSATVICGSYGKNSDSSQQ